MYAVGRSYAVESSASSGAVTRSSIGNPIGRRRRSISASTRSSASAALSRGIAYSISVKRTSRVFAYTRLLTSRCSERPISPARRRFSSGISPGKRRPSRQKRPSTAFSRTTSWRKAAARPGGVGHHGRLPVVARGNQLGEPRQHLVERARLVDALDREGGHAAQRERG